MNCRSHPTQTASYPCSTCDEPLCFYCTVKWRDRLYCAGCRDQASLIPPRRARLRRKPGPSWTFPALLGMQLCMWLVMALYLGRNLVR